MAHNLQSISKHMLGLGLGALAHANWHANYYSMENKYWNELSVLQAAHAAEILIKARITEEHPLLIFEQLPKSADSSNEKLDFKRLLEDGRTYQYSELPARLWATTGITLPNADLFKKFGQLRNTIQHFTSPDRDVSQEVVEFIFGVIDPFINQCWGLYAIDFNEDYEPYIYLIENVTRRGIRFLVSPDSVDDLEHVDFDWPDDDDSYKNEMMARFKKARDKAP